MIVSTRTGLSLEAADGYDFHEKVQQEWPPDKFTIELEPGELMRALKAG
jgi:hypothetical protein